MHVHCHRVARHHRPLNRQELPVVLREEHESNESIILAARLHLRNARVERAAVGERAAAVLRRNVAIGHREADRVDEAAHVPVEPRHSVVLQMQLLLAFEEARRWPFFFAVGGPTSVVCRGAQDDLLVLWRRSVRFEVQLGYGIDVVYLALTQVRQRPDHERLRVGNQVHLRLVLGVQKAVLQTKLVKLASLLPHRGEDAI